MNRAAVIVLGTVSYVVVLFATAFVLAPFMKVAMPEKLGDYFNLAMGGLLGFLAKTGIDAAKEKMEPGDKGEQQSP